MKLYYAPGTCSLAPHILLRETGLSHTLVKVDLNQHLTEQGDDFFQITAKGSVPLLQLDNGEVLSEGVVISQYICDLAGRDDLMPAAGSMARYRVMEWQNYITTELHKGYSPLFNPKLGQDTKAYFRNQLQQKFAWVARQLKDQPYLAGATFTAADAYLFTVASWSGMVGLDLTALAPLTVYLAGIAERPAVRAARLAERG